MGRVFMRQSTTKVLTDISSFSNSTENVDLHKIPPSSFVPFVLLTQYFKFDLISSSGTLGAQSS